MITITSDSSDVSIEIQVTTKQQAFLSDTVADPNAADPLQILIDVEELLMEEYGMTLLQAKQRGLFE